mmetsp:Transcript_13897/g.34317  ORF Transcript_13897/g.34317 Transcript_13897/m.34317 type:complete len:958 (+) Transcript_13897:177-3050(+)|eukprot:g20109.t1
MESLLSSSRENQKVRRSARADVERAFKQYCDPEIGKKYAECTSEKEKGAFREGFLGALEGMVTHSIQTEVSQQVSQQLKNKNLRQAGAGDITAKKYPVRESDALLSRLIQDRGMSDMRGQLLFEEHIKPAVARWGKPFSMQGMTPLVRHNLWFQQAMAPVLSETGGEKKHIVMNTTSSSVRKRGDTKAIDWTTLQPIFIKDLRLFNIHEGHVLEANIVGRPALQTAIQTVLADARGDQITASFYNCAGADITANTPIVRAQALVEKRFPIGATVRIANPFLKIGTGGLTALRLDDPRELVVQGTSAAASCINVAEEKDHGNTEFKKGCFEAARRIYMDALAAADLDLQVSMLNNRALMQLHLGEYEGAMLDAALVMVLRPGNEKAWHRYATAAKESGCAALGDAAEAAKQKALNRKTAAEQEQGAGSEEHPDESTAAEDLDLFSRDQRKMFERLLHTAANSWLQATPPEADAESGTDALSGTKATGSSSARIAAVAFSLERADQCNEHGKQCFRAKKFAAARAAFTEGILVLNADKSTRPLGALLGNLTTCALRTGRSVEGFALSLLTLRVFLPAAASPTGPAVSGNQVQVRNKALIRVVSALVNLGECGWVREFWKKVEGSFAAASCPGAASPESVAFLQKGYKAETAFMDFLEAQGQGSGFLGALKSFGAGALGGRDGAGKNATPGSSAGPPDLALPVLLQYLHSADPAALRSCDWISPNIELRDTGVAGKGRGVYAKRALKSGTVVMICRPDPGLSAEVDTMQSLKMGVDSSGGGILLDASQKEIQRQVMSRVSDDLALVWRLHRLYDGSAKFYEREQQQRRTVATFDVFLHCLPPFVFPALPPRPQFAAPRVVKQLGSLSESQIAGILDLNQFGSCRKGGLHSGPKRSTLHVPVSMFNHSIENQNTGFASEQTEAGYPGAKVVTLSKDVAAGEELFIIYTTDKEAERKWIGGA